MALLRAARVPVSVVTDSAACIPPDLRREYHIHVVPYQLIWNDQVYLDGRDLTPVEFYRRFRASSTYPTTATPTLGQCIEVFEQAAEVADTVVGIFVAANLTATMSVARRAAQEIAKPVHVVDAQTAASAQAFLVLKAARAAAAGATAEQVLRVVEESRPRTGMYFAFETLEHLHRGGRIGQAATLLGARLRIQPVLTLTGGQVRPVSVARTRQRALDRVLREVQAAVGENPARAAVFHADVPEEAEQMAERVQSMLRCVEFFISEFTPVMGAHTGPGVLGVAYCIEATG